MKKKFNIKNIPYPLSRSIRIDGEILNNYGFKKLKKKDIIGRDIWALKVPFYRYEFHFIMGNYPPTNPNCGILMLHEPAEEAVGFDRKGKKIIHKLPESTRTIASWVNTAERLRTIILSLTETNV